LFILFSDDALEHRFLHERCCEVGGMNFAKWNGDIMMILAIMDWDHSFCENKHIEPIAEGDNDTTLALRKADYEKAKA
jgi:hypothetical protein